jgi:hypothetical protein
MPVSYAHVEREKPRTIRDHTSVWNQLIPITQAGDDALAAVAQFCKRKRISPDALVQLGACITRRQDIGYCLAYSGTNGNGAVTAIKYRPLNGTCRARRGE